MAVYKDNATGTWRVIYRFTNWKGERKQTQKRGFATKREAQAWEHEAMLKRLPVSLRFTKPTRNSVSRKAHGNPKAM